jgi:hypothetical protein
VTWNRAEIIPSDLDPKGIAPDLTTLRSWPALVRQSLYIGGTHLLGGGAHANLGSILGSRLTLSPPEPA